MKSIKVLTSEIIYHELLDKHKDQLTVFSSISGKQLYGAETIYETVWGFKDSDFPLFGARTEWIDKSNKTYTWWVYKHIGEDNG